MIEDGTEGNRRIIANTILLYIRMALTMCISFFSTRLLLTLLGSTDFGLLNVVAGVVSLFSFINGTMSAAASRYFSCEIGRKNDEGLARIFSLMRVVFWVLALVVLVLSVVVGGWVIKTKLVIPYERMYAAECLFHLALLSFGLGIVTIPYISIVIAREHMGVFAIITICDCLFRVVGIYLLHYISSDYLVGYGGVLLVNAAIVFVSYRLFCRRFEECAAPFYWSGKMFREIIEFSGWNIFGSLASVANAVLGNVLLNIFFGPVVNAARGIAVQVSSAVAGLMANLLQASSPQIVKYYSKNQIDAMKCLVYNTARFAFLLMFIGVLPVFWKIDFLLEVWLANVPEHTSLFTRLILVNVLVDSMSAPIITSLLATGRIAVYQVVVGSIVLLNLPIAYLALRVGWGASSIFIISIILSVVALFARLFFARRLWGLCYVEYFRLVFLRILRVTVVGVGVVWVLSCSSLLEGTPNIFQVTVMILASVAIVIVFGLSGKERMEFGGYVRLKLKGALG